MTEHELIIEALHAWPERFPLFERDAYHWFCRSNDHHMLVIGVGESIPAALLDTAIKGQLIEGSVWDKAIAVLTPKSIEVCNQTESGL